MSTAKGEPLKISLEPEATYQKKKPSEFSNN